MRPCSPRTGHSTVSKNGQQNRPNSIVHPAQTEQQWNFPSQAPIGRRRNFPRREDLNGWVHHASPSPPWLPQIGFQIRTRVQDLGHGCIFLVQKAGALQVCPTDSYTKRELIECARAVTEKVRSSPGQAAAVACCAQRHVRETKPKTAPLSRVWWSSLEPGSPQGWGTSGSRG